MVLKVPKKMHLKKVFVVKMKELCNRNLHVEKTSDCSLTLRRPLRGKLGMRWFFDISKVKESSFFLILTSLTPPRIFDAHLLENTDFSPSRFHF